MTNEIAIHHAESKLSPCPTEPMYVHWLDEAAICFNPEISVGHSVLLRTLVDFSVWIDAVITEMNDNQFTATIQGFDSAERDSFDGMDIGHTINFGPEYVFSYSSE